MKIVDLDAHAVNPGDLSWEQFENFGELIIYERTPQEEVVNRAKDADAILINKIKITSEILEQLPKLRYIGEQELQNYNYNAADNLANKLDTTTLNRNLDYPINLYYSDSPYAREAFNDGTQGRTGSHTGYLRSINGSWKLIHNVHQNVRQNNLPDVLGSKNETGITWIGKGVPATADI